MKVITALKSIFIATFVALIGLGSSASFAQEESILVEIQKRGVLKVGLSTFVPWAMRDKDGNLIGFEVDVATQLAEDMGVEIEFVPTQWSGIIPALIAKKFDVIIGGMSITPQRNLTVNFTRPYANSGQQMIAHVDLATDTMTLEDFNSPNIVIACRRGATPCTTSIELFPQAEIRRFDDDAQAFQEVVNGNATAAMSSIPTPAFWVERHSDKLFLPFNGELVTKGNEAMALRKGDPDALNFFSNWILLRQADGWLQERHDYWFKSEAGWKDIVSIEQ